MNLGLINKEKELLSDCPAFLSLLLLDQRRLNRIRIAAHQSDAHFCLLGLGHISAMKLD